MGLFKNRQDNDIFEGLEDENLEVNTLDEEDGEKDSISEDISDEELEELEEVLSGGNTDDEEYDDESSYEEEDAHIDLSDISSLYEKKLSGFDEDDEYDDSVKKKEMDSILSSLEDIENGVVEDAFRKKLQIQRVSEEDLLPSDEATIISKGTTIGGGINASGHLEIYGDVNGDVECKGKLTILGNVTGNATAAEIYINTSRFEGDIRSKGAVKIGVGTVVIGNVTGTSALIAGAIKGEVDIIGPTILDSTAVVKGNVKAKSVQINNGAVLQGFCALAYSDVDIDDFFEAEEFK